MAIYSVPFQAVAVSVAQDLWEIVTPASTRLALREIRLGQYSDFGDAQAEILSVGIYTGFTVAGSGGSAATPVNLSRHTGKAVSVCTAAINNTTVANTSGTLVISDVFNVAAGWWYYPPEEERIIVEVSSRLNVRITAPADSLTMNGTLIFQEVGKGGQFGG